MNVYRITFSILLFLSSSWKMYAQDINEMMNRMKNESLSNKSVFVNNTFMTTRVVDGQSVNQLPAHVLDLRISHRFGPLSSGAYDFFGLDHATMRLGFDYGITENLMVGIGHSTYQKTYDAFFKLRLLQQRSGYKSVPLTVSFVSIIALNTLKPVDSSRIRFQDRLSSVYQLLIARKFSESFAIQVMPTFIQLDNISFDHSNKYIIAFGIGSRQKVSKRVNLNAEYYYQLPGMQAPGSHNVFSLGIDIGTGGHVFQLHFTNSSGLTEKSFIAETTGRWDKSDVMFGFNISRVFQLKKKTGR